jgi:hypothetical protein
MSDSERFRSSVAYLRRSTVIRIININGKKRPLTQKNVMKRSKALIKRSGTLNGQERLGTFESEGSNATERIVENGHGTITFTFQKRKNYCNERLKTNIRVSRLILYHITRLNLFCPIIFIVF